MTSKVDFFYDLIDQAVMLYCERLNLNYFEALLKVGNDIFNGQIDDKIDDEDNKKTEKLYQIINEESFLNEEIRLALELLIVKAFKHINFSLDLMTPDSICYLITYLIKKLYRSQKLTIIDTLLGTSNLISAISNHYDGELSLIGIENNLKLVELSKVSTNLQNNEIKIYYQDALSPIFDLADVIIGDLDNYHYQDQEKSFLNENGVTYFPYLVIEARLRNLKDNGYFIYIIENDFFAQNNVDIFKTFLDKEVTLMGLIVLPKTAFQKDHIGKSILIGKKTIKKSYNMMVLEIPSFEENILKSSLQKIDKLITIL